MAHASQSVTSDRRFLVRPAPSASQRVKQADVVITLFVVGLLLAITTLFLNFTSPHVNVIMAVGSCSALSFVGALIAWVMMSNTPLPRAPTKRPDWVEDASTAIASPQNRSVALPSQLSHDPVHQLDRPLMVTPTAEAGRGLNVDTVQRAPDEASASASAAALTTQSAPAGRARFAIPMSIESGRDPDAAGAEPIPADSAPASAAAAAMASRDAAAKPPLRDVFASYLDMMDRQGHITFPPPSLPLGAFLKPGSEGFNYLTRAIFTGQAQLVEDVCWVERDDNDHISIRGILDIHEGLTPLQWTGQYLRVHWDRAQDKNVLMKNGRWMLASLLNLVVHSPSGNISMKDVKNRDGKTALEYFKNDLIPIAPADLRTFLFGLIELLH